MNRRCHRNRPDEHSFDTEGKHAAADANEGHRERQAAAQADAGLAEREVAHTRKLGAVGAASLSALDTAEAQVWLDILAPRAQWARMRDGLPARPLEQIVAPQR